jgi:hypothetical protein
MLDTDRGHFCKSIVLPRHDPFLERATDFQNACGSGPIRI